MEGVGKVGHRLVDHLVEAEADVIICDVSGAAIEAVRARHPQVRAVDGIEALIAEKLDVLAPCALGGTLTENTVHALTARIVCGAANNQLAHQGIEKLLADRGILYAPDYAINAGGLVNVAQEVVGYDEAKAHAKTLLIHDTIAEIIDRAEKLKAPTHKVADMLVEERLAAAIRKR